ncbi:MAG: DUF3039 domain-containing protein [Actinomycetota bacterium]
MRIRFTATHDAPGSPGAPDAPSGSPEGATTLLEREETAEESSEGDRFAHYVRKDRIAASAASGRPVVALCGKVWTPRRDPSRYPICPECKEILQSLQSGGKDGDR